MSQHRPGRQPEDPPPPEIPEVVGRHTSREIRRRAEMEEMILRQQREITRLSHLANEAGPQSSLQASLAREHELARMRSKTMSPLLAGADLAERLSLAHRQAGKPSLTLLCGKVGCSKSTLSKVFNNKMAPSWPLVRKLGEQLRVPRAIVMQDWLPIWMAADAHKQSLKTDTVRGTAPVPAPKTAPAPAADAETETQLGVNLALTGPTGFTCAQCGLMVGDTAVHLEWHAQRDPLGISAPDAESMGAGRNAESAEIRFLREAYGTDER